MVIAICALATAMMGVQSMSSPISAGALGFIVWALTPYAYLVAMAKLVSRKAPSVVVVVLAFVVGVFGVWALMDAMIVHPDAQGGLIFVFAPAWQWALMLLATLPFYYLNRVKNA